MAIKMSSRQVIDTFPFTIKIGYCDLYYPLVYQRKVGYTCGVYGWNSDIYFIGDTAISTGYRPFGKKVSRGLISHYNEAAREIYDDRNIEFTKKVERLNAVLKDFVGDAKKELLGE
jgi:hypothetical protein